MRRAATRFLPALLLAACGVAAADGRADAIRAFEQRDDRAARAQLETLAKAAPDDAELQNYLGRARLRANDVDGAVKALERAVELAPSNSRFHLDAAGALGAQVSRVNMLRKMGIAGRVRDHMLRAVELAPDSVRAREALAQYYAQAPGIAGGSLDKAREQVAAIGKLDAGAALRLQAWLLRFEKKPDAEVDAAFDRAIAADDAEGRARFEYGQVLQARERWEQAFAQFDALARARPGVPGIQYQIGKTAALSGQRLADGEKALRSYLETGPKADSDPGRDAAHWRLGMVLEKAGRKDEARAQYQAALRENPDNEQARDALKALD